MSAPQSINIILLITALAWTESLAGQAKLAAHAPALAYKGRPGPVAQANSFRLTSRRQLLSGYVLLRNVQPTPPLQNVLYKRDCLRASLCHKAEHSLWQRKQKAGSLIDVASVLFCSMHG